jgi:predicted nucleic acid-binding protein
VRVAPRRGPIVIDTDVFGAELIKGSALAERYAPPLAGRPAFISFQTATEVRYGALARRWGPRRLLALESKLANVAIVHSGPALIAVHAPLRADCRTAGRALAQREHNADRWIAATRAAQDGDKPDVSSVVRCQRPSTLSAAAASAGRAAWARSASTCSGLHATSIAE